jgi:tetratricopeptide (TPR) repeat protein
MPVSRVLSREEIDAIVTRVESLAGGGDKDAAWSAAAPLLEAQAHDQYAAHKLIDVVRDGYVSHEHALAALEAIDSKHLGDVEIAIRIALNLDCAININFLNAAPSDLALFTRVIDFLDDTWKQGNYKDEPRLLDGLAAAARLFGRQRDAVAERAYRRLIALDPNTHFRHYNYGLFLKTRGRFEEGMRANQMAASLSETPSEATQWNLGICATGAGKGDVALKVWKDMGHKINLGRFDLPDGRFPSCKVTLAQRPLAERTSDIDDPGQEETIWIERLSACHGIIRSVLYHDLGVNYGDVILFDGAPITHHKYDDEKIPVFPHIATLRRRNYQLFDFAGTQDQPKRLSEITNSLGREAVVYAHSENFVTLCANCWNDPNTNHARHEEMTKHIVTGRIAAPPDMDPRELLRQIDAGMKGLAPCQIYAPALCKAAGLPDRARIEQRRFEMLSNN